MKTMKKVMVMMAMMVMMVMTQVTVYAAAPEEVILQQMNAERQAAGLSALSLDATLTKAAAVRAQEASVKWSHVRPDGTAYYTVDSAHVYGENLGKGTEAQMTTSIVSAFMASPSHKANVLYKTSTKCGISIYKAADGTNSVAVEFN